MATGGSLIFWTRLLPREQQPFGCRYKRRARVHWPARAGADRASFGGPVMTDALAVLVPRSRKQQNIVYT
jgi:hypothetical protein